jgi:sugar phosphate permease
MDISSEMVHSLLPVFLVSVLGSSYTSVGLIEGLGEGVTLLFKMISGPLSDRLRNRKSLVFIGYTLAALSKPLFAVAQSSAFVFGARLLDRMGKGIRGAPRDALLADLAPKSLWGQAFGLRQSLDTVGAFVGPLLAILFMSLLKDDFRMIFWIAVLPGLLSVSLIVFGIREPEYELKNKGTFSFRGFRNFSQAFWLVCICGAVLQLARFSEAFLILRAKDLGLSFKFVPLIK